ncbi:MAG: 50S ribosomal protein L2 [Opitutales bacterium]
MPLQPKKPITAGQRFRIANKVELSKERPVRSLTKPLKKSGGRNNNGRITVRRRGGGHKRLYREIDFLRNKEEMSATVERLEYDPNRSSHIALIRYEDGELAYIPAPLGLEPGDTVKNTSQPQETFPVGLNIPLKLLPPATFVHCIELTPGRGAQMARAAGQQAQLVNVEGKNATIKMPSGEIRMVNAKCRATVGRVGNIEHGDEKLGKAGRNRWKGKRPRVRGVAMNPVDHPMGGGEGRTSGGGHPVSPWGQLAKGFPTRKRSKPSNSMIIVRRNGKKVRKG